MGPGRFYLAVAAPQVRAQKVQKKENRMTDSLSVKKISPLPGYALVEPAKRGNQTVSGIYLPDGTDEKPQYGTVLAVGAATMIDGAKVESPVKVGDKVVYKKWGGNDFEIDDIEYQFLKFEDLLAVIKK